MAGTESLRSLFYHVELITKRVMKAWDVVVVVVVGNVGYDYFRLMGNSYMEDSVFGKCKIWLFSYRAVYS